MSKDDQRQPLQVIHSLFFFQLCLAACRILVPWPGIEPGAQQWKRGVLTTGQPGNYEWSSFFKYLKYSIKYICKYLKYIYTHTQWLGLHALKISIKNMLGSAIQLVLTMGGRAAGGPRWPRAWPLALVETRPLLKGWTFLSTPHLSMPLTSGKSSMEGHWLDLWHFLRPGYLSSSFPDTSQA